MSFDVTDVASGVSRFVDIVLINRPNEGRGVFENPNAIT